MVNRVPLMRSVLADNRGIVFKGNATGKLSLWRQYCASGLRGKFETIDDFEYLELGAVREWRGGRWVVSTRVLRPFRGPEKR
jgi:hypothetical protein